MIASTSPNRKIDTIRHSINRQRGAAALLAMMCLVVFGSLAAAMAIIAEGNLSTADAHLKINRSLSAAETGMRYVTYRMALTANDVQTRTGLIDATKAGELWDELRTKLLDPAYAHSLVNEPHNVAEPYAEGDTLYIGPIAVGPAAPTFTAVITPHPIASENYNSAYYQRPPYSTMSPAVSMNNPLDATWVRVRVTGTDGPSGKQVTRTIQMDFKIDKKIRFAILSKSRVMIGRNVMIKGAIGSRFMDTHLPNGHPIQMASDFRGLDEELDEALDALIGTLITNDVDGDNRIHLANPAEVAGIANPTSYDLNHDGYIDEFDAFLGVFDANADGSVAGVTELGVDSDINRRQLLELIDTFGDPSRPGYNDGVINSLDRYAKIRGAVKVSASLQSWLDGAAGGVYQDYFQGPIHVGHDEVPLTFQAADNDVHEFNPEDFDMTSFKTIATGDLAAQAAAQAANHDPDDPDSPQPLGAVVREEVPYGAAHPYDYYDRPVYKNMTFTNVTIPKGTNALFVNCKFIGCTFVETEVNNNDANFNFVGMTEQDGTPKFPALTATVNGATVADTKPFGNNIRFDGCTFEGAIVTDPSPNYTHVRNKISFTGTTQFLNETSPNLTATEKALYKRSTILAPHYSVEMGTFIAPDDDTEIVRLTGTIVAGVLDMRGQVKVTGTILTTFEPQVNSGPVIGETSPNFNTTLGYFASTSGDFEAEIPDTGVGVIQVIYDPTIALPDGILGPIEIMPNYQTYFESN